MAKTKQKKSIETEGGKKHSLFQWILFVVCIPLLFALTVALVVMTIAGVNVFEKAKEIAGNVPYVSEWAGDGTVKDGKSEREKVAELQGEIKNKEATIKKLNTDLENAKTKVEDLLTEQDRLNAQLKQLQKQQQETGESQAQKQTANIIKTYETMDEESIAGILINLTDKEAVNILKELSVEKQADVFEALESKKAAEYTNLLSNE